ncbi:electron transfer flavoprotein beta subunit/FixA family protein [Bacteriovorax stolpii]|uniref:Electron transfer flavoprotein subunit beta n=1 Tax=Bacteriovorax stolpii TaxID=960 RepID=A0A2K9NZG7_BACTC|nr:electron transfer flavoprotein subunit beta/FixA family protein [Bacteriovorax stolpii]AUO00075.1 electron transfer flavoprotein subunit beta [Bacteriovorax stolpii]QDK39933.1 electron transfer flavoprotein beta subunit/FixA family protein [Bacteriovorax stolpii]TDP54032.1 electron transfer flavoprotein beta subunit [Bacteriovorax stolpii]BDT30266.1 electron transfer flavoprotein subunit beta/FixA family protein [Bacteriovorax sp. HI3]
MNIFVCVKQVPDTETKIVPSGDGSFIETSSIKWIMNPYDEFAVEQALLVQAANAGSTVTVVRVGSVKDTEALRTAMAMGADDAFLVEAADNLDSYMIAKALKGAIEKSGKTPDLILSGKQAIDDDCLQVPQILATMLNLPSVSVVVGYEGSATDITVKREVEGGALEVYGVKLPAMIACNKGINTPRYASLPGIMKAKKKPLTTLSLADVGVSDADKRVKYSNFQLPPEKPPGKKFDATDAAKQAQVVKDVVGLLRTEAKVI